MSTISLRTYIREIDSLIDQGRLDEAIAHSRHILSKFPKHIETYRLLGKAYLENNQNSNAADIFQRVLSAVPDDFISCVGMSVIREEEGNLAASVQHMEKAFEKQPYNSEIQIELRRLYGKRDGAEPPKVRLTQGALSRMYIRGDLIKQGISELRAAINENPERYDLKTLLAETYLTGDQLANAIDLASNILKKYPFNLTANRIIARSLKTHDHPQEMAICTKRLYSLSPYEAYISEHAPTLEQVPDRAITIDQVEWDEAQQNLSTKTRESILPWSTPSGRTDPSKNKGESESVPDWLSPPTREKEIIMPDENTGASLPEDQNQNSNSNDQENSVPDWMQEAGWEKSSGTVDESIPVFDDLEGEDEIVPADIPAWLEDAAPEGFSLKSDTPPDQDKAESAPKPPAITEDDLIPISPLDDSPPEPLETGSRPEVIPAVKAEEPEMDVPSWLMNLELDEDSQETAIAWLDNMPESLRSDDEQQRSVPGEDKQPGTDDISDDLDWMSDLYSQEEEKSSTAELSENLVAAELIPEQQQADKLFNQEEIESIESEVPSWLDELGDESAPIPSPEPSPEIIEEIIPEKLDISAETFSQEFDEKIQQPAESEQAGSLMPDWLSEIDSEDEVSAIESPPVPPEITPTAIEEQPEIPDWLEDFQEEQTVQEADVETDSLAWLESLSEKQEVPDDELFSSAEEPTQSQAPEETFTPIPESEPIPESPPDYELFTSAEEPIQAHTPEDAFTPVPESELTPEVSSDDETLSTEIPDWLSNLDDQEIITEPEASTEDIITESKEEPAASVEDLFAESEMEPEASAEDIVAESEEEPAASIEDLFTESEMEPEASVEDIVAESEEETVASAESFVAEGEFEDSASWLDQIDEKPITKTTESSTAEEDSDVLKWLEALEDDSETLPTDDDIRKSLADDLIDKTPPIEQETTEAPPAEEIQTEGMPDWLAELETDEQDEASSLQSAIRQSDHPLTEEEKDFLERTEEKQDENADWLAKLDMIDDLPPAEPETPAIKVDVPEEKEQEKPIEEFEGASVSGGILDRLKDSEKEGPEPEVPQWLENLKKEEDPQETAILWLKQFVEQGDKANLKAEIKRYTDELDPGDTVPEWMEDLKNEEDPQTTAMLWLEKLSGEREEASKTKPPREVPDESGWLADLEKEAAEQSKEPVKDKSQDFKDANEGWLADLEIDEKLKTSTDEDIPDWTQTEESGEIDEQDGETPPWMKATSPLEGDFYTDELSGNAEKEVEIPEWLAGYSEGEKPEEEVEPGPETPASVTAPSGAAPDQDEYTWVSSTDDPVKPSREPIDLNKAAISQLESILGISYQVAKGIVTYREKHGPYKTMEDLLNVPDIKDKQTIEILKPEVIIREVKEKPKPVEKTSPAVEEEPEKRLTRARNLLSASKIDEALEHYEYLIIKKKSVPEVINDLIQASFDHPLDVPLMKTLGDAFMRVNKLDEALEAYSKAEDLLL
jgi:competence ComEA-like helix-hairpin-helix protein